MMITNLMDMAVYSQPPLPEIVLQETVTLYYGQSPNVKAHLRYRLKDYLLKVVCLCWYNVQCLILVKILEDIHMKFLKAG